ncbi:MAG TPA: PQQ-dependent sugar dehydrogenase [Candidatus Acidoferrum sp.]|nr:PQQ-dependent sugar dehydrogenase [Candidatus Acidoferrum sp.]
MSALRFSKLWCAPIWCVLAASFFLGCNGGTSNPPPPPPPPATLQVELVPVASGLTTPLDIQQAGDASGRLFVVEQEGRIKIIQNANVLGTPYLDISSSIVSGGETGLLGLAFHPSFSTNGCIYVNYTSTRNGKLQTFISEFHAASAAANTVNPTSEQNLFTVDQPEANHNGGGLAFGNDGFLYIGLGDGGGAGDQHGTIGNAQDLTTRLGKMLRISVTCNGTLTVPSDNPFFTNATAAKEIWLYGLRNPFRFSIDHTTGNLWIGDVGQDSFEEVDMVTPKQGGSNMGWRCKEGTHNFNFTANCQTATFLDPIFDYDHSQGDDTVIGGYVYHGTNITGLAGNYIFGDFISGRIWSLAQNAQGQWVRTFLVNSGANNLAGFGQDASGELYVAQYGSGVVARLHKVGTP